MKNQNIDDNINEIFRKEERKEKSDKLKKSLHAFLFGLLLTFPPILMYFFVKWDPIFINREDDDVSVAIWLLAIIYWVVFFQIYKYRERSIRRTRELAQLLSDRWTIEEREEERRRLTSDFLFMNHLKDECPEVFENNTLKLP